MQIYKQCYLKFLIGAVGYCLIEILWRGYTHPSMGIAGGISFIAISYINNLKGKSRIFRAFLCALFITAIELIFGIIVNKILRLGIWDYSSLPFNFMGQICLLFSFFWFLLSYAVIRVLEKAFDKPISQ